MESWKSEQTQGQFMKIGFNTSKIRRRGQWAIKTEQGSAIVWHKPGVNSIGFEKRAPNSICATGEDPIRLWRHPPGIAGNGRLASIEPCCNCWKWRARSDRNLLKVMRFTTGGNACATRIQMLLMVAAANFGLLQDCYSPHLTWAHLWSLNVADLYRCGTIDLQQVPLILAGEKVRSLAGLGRWVG